MTDNRVEEFLAHYASKYYDPVKAREYYLRTRELKGDQPALSKESREQQRQASAYVRNEISTRKKSDLDANAVTRDQLRNSAQSQAEAHQARMVKLQTEAKAAQEAIVNKLKSEIEKIRGELKIPANANPKLRAYLEKQQAVRSKSAQARIQNEMSNLSKNLKSVIDKVRDDYVKSREANAKALRDNIAERQRISEMYRNDLLTEMQNIKDQVR